MVRTDRVDYGQPSGTGGYAYFQRFAIYESLPASRGARPLAGQPIPLSAHAPSRGQTCAMVGFGGHLEEATTYWQKRVVTSDVVLVTTSSVKVAFGTAIAHFDDSGGPRLCNGETSGVVSCHPDGPWPEHSVRRLQPCRRPAISGSRDRTRAA